MPASPEQAAKARERRKQALQLRLAGVTFEAIADQLGYSSRGDACTDVRRALAQSQAELDMTAEEFRRIELDRYDRLFTAVYPAALRGDVKAVDSCLRISEARRKLMRLDPAEQVEVVTVDQIDKRVADLSRQFPEAAAAARERIAGRRAEGQGRARQAAAAAGATGGREGSGASEVPAAVSDAG